MAQGKGLSPGQFRGLVPPTSWLAFHGTSLHWAVIAICCNGLSRSEKERGAAHAADSVAQAREGTELTGFETTAGRGIYATQQWHKARQYALPFTMDGSLLTVHVVLLLRIPGGLGKVGVPYAIAGKGKPSWLPQLDEAGARVHLKNCFGLFLRQ